MESLCADKTDRFTQFDQRLQVGNFLTAQGPIIVAVHQHLQLPVGFGGQPKVGNSFHQITWGFHNGVHEQALGMLISSKLS
jgi:hypothetical protein